MINQTLKIAAENAGITDEQATAFVKELGRFTHGMANAGNVGIPPFVWPEDKAELFAEVFQGWDGLTSGEFYGTRAAVIWRSVCSYLLSEEDFYAWEDKTWPHPVKK